MGKYRVIAGQNLYDIALHIYGSIEGIVDLMMCNTDLSLDTMLKVGDELIYSDDFIINSDVVAYNEMHSIVPSNGEHHIYPKIFTKPLAVAFSLPTQILSVQCSVSGIGTLEIAWGDNSDTEVITLTDKPQLLKHIFDNKVRKRRRIRWFTDAYFKQVDWSGLQPTSVVVLRPLPIEELTIKDATLTLDSLQMVTGIYSLNLSGLTSGNLKPLVECRELMTLNLTDARIKPTVLDEWLIAIVERYGNRRNCKVTLTAVPAGTYQEPARNADTGKYIITSGMEAIWVITHEESWNEGGKWKFIINDKEYSV